jgi:hypothetical protein
MGLLLNGVKYILLMNNNDFKNKSLNDNVYFTLRDIFLNANCADTCSEVNNFNYSLVGDVSFHERTEQFQYSNILDDKNYIYKLLNWLGRFNVYWFEFEEGEEFMTEDYIKFDDWWIQFEELKGLLQTRFEELKN